MRDLPPAPLGLGRLAMEPAFGRVEIGISDVPKVDVPKKRVGLAHALQGSDRADP